MPDFRIDEKESDVRVESTYGFARKLYVAYTSGRPDGHDGVFEPL